MQKVIKHISLGIVVLFAIGLISANIGKIYMSKKNKEFSQSLEGMIAEINKQLPQKGINGFDFFVMEKMELEDNCIVWNFTLDTTFFYPKGESVLPESINGSVLASGDRNCYLDLDTLLSNDFLKKSHQLHLLYYNLFVRSVKPDKLKEEIMKRHLSQTWRMNSPFSDRQIEFTIKYEEQKQMEEYCLANADVALQVFISEYLKRQNRLLSVASKNDDIIMCMKETNSQIIFNCTFDRSYSVKGNKPVANLRNNKSDILDALQKDYQTNPFFWGTKDICKKVEKQFLFRYTDWNKTDSIDFIMY